MTQYILKDSQVEMLWRCDCCGYTCRLPPDFYELNGTPMCNQGSVKDDEDCFCGDLFYMRTYLVLGEDSE